MSGHQGGSYFFCGHIFRGYFFKGGNGRIGSSCVGLRVWLCISPSLGFFRAFTNEVEHNPFDTELFAAVLTAFSGKVDRPMVAEDYQRLRLAVVHHRQRRREKEQEQVAELWPEEEELSEEEVPPSPCMGGVEAATLCCIGVPACFPST